MSELSKLIEINSNIEKQNTEIIRLLKKIAGENDTSHSPENVKKDLLDISFECGEVCFIDDGDIFQLTIKNNEISINNLTGNSETTNFNLAEKIAKESLSKNQSLDDSTCILTDSVEGKLPETLKMCIENGAKKAFIPWNLMSELIRAPQELQILLKLDFFKSDDDLLDKLFK